MNTWHLSSFPGNLCCFAANCNMSRITLFFWFKICVCAIFYAFPSLWGMLIDSKYNRGPYLLTYPPTQRFRAAIWMFYLIAHLTLEMNKYWYKMIRWYELSNRTSSFICIGIQWARVATHLSCTYSTPSELVLWWVCMYCLFCIPSEQSNLNFLLAVGIRQQCHRTYVQ